MENISAEEKIFDFIEPALVKGIDGKYNTANGRKSKLALLTSIKTILDDNKNNQL